ncbi:hypothetical protein MRX96_003632 [Rhipicephalus microplus]
MGSACKAFLAEKGQASCGHHQCLMEWESSMLTSSWGGLDTPCVWLSSRLIEKFILRGGLSATKLFMAAAWPEFT